MNEKAVAVRQLAEEQLGSPYVYGAWGEPCSTSIRKRYAGYNPAHKKTIYAKCQILSNKRTSCTFCKYAGKRAFDCRGFVHWIFKTAASIDILGSGATSQWTKKAQWAVRGSITDLPDLVCALYKRKGSKMIHCGIHVGGGRVIHCSSGVEGGKADHSWTHFAIPVGMYTDDEIASAPIIGEPYSVLVKGCEGRQVVKLQQDLTKMGIPCGKVDGIFGARTLEAVKKCQKRFK